MATSITNQIDLPPVNPKHLKPIYIDDHIIVVNKPSGVLSVPGPRRHECIASLAYRYFGKSNLDIETNQAIEDSDVVDHVAAIDEDNNDTWQSLTSADNKQIDTMVVHRLDRDTSGVLIFARNDNALKQLHNDFKDKTRKRVSKRYVALVCGHWNGRSNVGSSSDSLGLDEGEIDLPLVRDMERPPFMRVATVETIDEQQRLKDHPQKQGDQQRQQHSGYLRMVGKGPKASLTTYRILSYEYLTDGNNHNYKDTMGESDGSGNPPRLLPVTRVELQPITGRTHQLRVHCAAIGHPIVGDSIYGYNGEGCQNGGLKSDEVMSGASSDVQRDVHNYWMRRQQDRTCQKQINLHDKNHNLDDGCTDDVENDECMLCLHAYQLSIHHPLTQSPMMFECPPSF